MESSRVPLSPPESTGASGMTGESSRVLEILRRSWESCVVTRRCTDLRRKLRNQGKRGESCGVTKNSAEIYGVARSHAQSRGVHGVLRSPVESCGV